MKKLLVLTLSLIITCCLFAIPSFAEGVAEDPVDGSEDVGEPLDTPTAEETLVEEEKAATVLLTEWVSTHFGDIAAAIGAVGMAVVVWMFKKGLLPAVLKSLGHVKENADKYTGEFKEETKALVQLIECAEKRLAESETKLEGLVKAYQDQQEATVEAYELQTELINYIMMNLRIPNEMKAKISTDSASVKAALESAKTKKG